MRKNFMSTLVLAGVLVGLILWYALYEKKLKISNKEAREDTKRFVELVKKDVQEFVIEKRTDASTKEKPVYETLAFKKTGDDWYLTSPLNTQADNSMVSSAISTLTSAKHDRILEESPKDLSAFGLDHPVLKLKVRKNSNSEYEEVLLGDDTPVGFNLYVIGAKDKKVYVTSRSIKSSFEKPLKDFRDKKIIRLASSEFDELEIKAQGQTFILKEDGKTKQWVLARSNIPASKTEVQKTLSALVGLRAKDFIEPKDNKGVAKALANPRSRVKLMKRDAKDTIDLRVAKVGDKSYAKRADGDTIYEVDTKFADTIARAKKEYRELAIADFNRFKVAKVKLIRQNDTLELEKSGDTWKLKEDENFKVDKSKVESLLAALQDTKLTRYEMRKVATGTQSPRLEVQLEDDQGATMTHLKFGKKVGMEVYATREGLDTPFFVKFPDYKGFDLSKASFAPPPEKKTHNHSFQPQTQSVGE